MPERTSLGLRRTPCLFGHEHRSVCVSHVAPFDDLRLDGGRLCFQDLWVRSGFGGDRWTSYLAVEEGGGSQTVDGQRCVMLPAREGYRVITLSARRPGERRFGPALKVHLVEKDGARRIVGLER